MDIITLFCEIDDFLVPFEECLPAKVLPFADERLGLFSPACLCVSELDISEYR